MALTRKKNISKSSLTSIVEGFRNFIGLTDDAWSASEFFLTKISKKIAVKTAKISPYLEAISGGIFSLFEIYDAIKQLVKELKRATLSTQKSLLIMNTLRIIAAGVAAGLSSASIAAAAGATGISGVMLFPFLAPALLTLSNVFRLVHEGGRLHSIRKKQAAFKAELKHDQEANKALLQDITKQQEVIQESKKQYSDKYDLIAIKAKKQKNSEEFIALFSYNELLKKEKQLSEQTALMKRNTDIQQNTYQKIKRERLNTERRVAFEAIGVTAATAATIGILLGTAAIIGAASVLALSTLATGLLIGAGVIGLGLMIFSVVDKKKENRPHFIFAQDI